MKKYLLLVVFCIALAGAAGIVYAQAASSATLSVSLAKYDPYPAEANRIVTIWFDVTNNGGDATQNATILFRDQYPFTIMNNNEKNIGVIRGGDIVRVEYRALVDKFVPSGVTEFEIEYAPSGKLFTKKKFDISVERSKNQTDLKALFVKLDPVAYPGAKSTLTIDVTNVADGTAFYLIASASSDAADIDRKDVYVGTLKADEFESVDFDLKFRSDIGPGTYPVSIKMMYKNDDGEEVQESDIVMVKILTKNDAQTTQAARQPVEGYIILIIIIILVVRFSIPFFRWFVKPFKRKKGEV